MYKSDIPGTARFLLREIAHTATRGPTPAEAKRNKERAENDRKRQEIARAYEERP